MTKTPAMRETLAASMIAVLERVMDLMLQALIDFTRLLKVLKKLVEILMILFPMRK